LNPILDSLIWCIKSLFLLMEIVQESRPCVRGSLKKKKKSWYNLIRNVFDRRKGKTSGIHRIFLASIKTSEKNKLYHIFLNLIQFMSSCHINRKLNHKNTLLSANKFIWHRNQKARHCACNYILKKNYSHWFTKLYICLCQFINLIEASMIPVIS